MRFIIDLDNTICRTNEYFFYNCKIRFGRHDLIYDKEALKDYHLTHWFTNNKLASEIEAMAMKEQIFNDQYYWESIPPMEGAIEILTELSKKHEVFIATDAITIKNEAVMTGKKRWLVRFLPSFNTSQLIFIQNKNLLKGDVIIEDIVEQVKFFTGKVILFDYCYNRFYVPDYRVTTWKEVDSIIKEII